MSFDAFGSLNWLAIIVGAVAYFAIGAAWFSPVGFGRAWQRSIGWDPERTPPQMQATTYVIPLVAFLVMGIAIGLLTDATGTDTLGGGIVLGLVVAIGLAVMHTAVDATFDPNKPQPWLWLVINGGYHAVGLMILAILLAVWH